MGETPDSADARAFLAGHPPFSALPGPVLDALPARLRTLEVDAGTIVLRTGAHVQWLYIVRFGTIAIRGTGGDLWSQRIEGETFGVQALLTDARSGFDAEAITDATLWLLPDTVFARLKAEHEELERYFVPLGGTGGQPPHAFDRPSIELQTNLMALRVGELMTPDPPTIAPDRPVREAALSMRTHDLSCLPVVEGDRLVGLIDQRALARRIVAEGLAAETPVSALVTPDAETAVQAVPAETIAWEAVQTMRAGRLSHLPVTREGRHDGIHDGFHGARLVGLLDEAVIRGRQEGDLGFLNPLLIRRQTPASLAEVVARVPQVLVTLVETGVPALRIGMALTSVTDTVTWRLLEQAEAWLGPAPVPFVWVCGGSQARQEQTAITDQDNFLILDDSYDEGRHGAYFEELARSVCDGLNACGFEYCPGEMMAMTPKWRRPLADWIGYFATWIEEPSPEAQMLASVMFDLRPLRGDASLFDRLQDATIEKARANSLFLAHLAGNALTHTPSIGLFRRFVLSHSREHGEHLDLKLHGTVPIIDLARVYALKAGVRTANTHDRLVEAARAGVLSAAGKRELIDAFEFVSSVRLRHQSRCIQAGRRPDAFVSPDELTRIERHRLRSAFASVKALQSSLAGTWRVER